MSPRRLKGEEEKSLVLHDRPTQRSSGLYARVCRLFHITEWVGRLDVAVAQIRKRSTMELVRASARDDVYHSARRPPVFRGISVGDDLKLLYRVLRHRGADPVHRVIDRIDAVNVHQIAARALSSEVKTRGRCRADAGRDIARRLRVGQREINVVAAVD